MAGRLVEVAVPVPLRGPLTYGLREGTEVAPGCRVRVPVGKRQLVGVVMARVAEPPGDFAIKPVREVLDVEPVLTGEQLDLARFVSDYYLAPIGDAIRVMIPSSLPPWGDRRVSLTDAGALTPPRDGDEAALVDALRSGSRQRLADLQRTVVVADLARLVERLSGQGRVSVEEPGRRGTRYVKAVELRPGSLDAHLEACGKAPAGRGVVEYLAALGRPATYAEVKQAVECGDGVIRRLIERDVLRQFSQPERLSLARHRLETQTPDIVLRPDQARASEAMLEALDATTYASFLLDGMTGSGKTEVYLRVVDRALAQGRGAILLVPEIALVPSLADTVCARFGPRLAILHSNLSANERHQEWERVRRGDARVILGPRSAVFAPLDKIGCIVIDEEHDSAYKQDASPRYNGRDLALLRAREHGAVAVLVSATPSLESRHNVERGKHRALRLTERVGRGGLPEGVLVDLRQEKAPRQPGEVPFSEPLRVALDEALDKGDQVILLRNRRGYAPVLLCRACGEDFRCPDCGLPLTVHRRARTLSCHYCDHARPIPVRCPACEEQALEPIGAGTERVEERFQAMYPGVAVDVLDADSARRPGGAAAVLQRFARGTSQVLIGTQMVAKGHHFPRVSLAAVLFADTYLGFPDFRAVERTYALITQLAGRAGRGDRPGKVVIQTYHPSHYAIRAALGHDDDAFASEELHFRKVFHYPPYSRMAQVLVQHRDREEAAGKLDTIAGRLRSHPLANDVRLAGPAAAPLERLRNRWRFQLLLRGPSGARLKRLLREVVGDPVPPEVTLDIDPHDLM